MMFNNISGINFRGGNLIINQKNGKSETISSDKITSIENIPTTNWEKFKGVYVYTEGANIANHPVRIKIFLMRLLLMLIIKQKQKM